MQKSVGIYFSKLITFTKLICSLKLIPSLKLICSLKLIRPLELLFLFLFLHCLLLLLCYPVHSLAQTPGVSTPAESITKLRLALLEKRGTEVSKYLDLENLTENILNDAETLVKSRNKNDFKALEQWSKPLAGALMSGDYTRAKKIAREITLFDTKRYLGNASFAGYLASTVVGNKGVLLPYLTKLDKRNDFCFQGVKNTRVVGNQAMVSLSWYWNKHHSTITGIFRMEKIGDHWQIKKLLNTKAVVVQFENANKHAHMARK